MKLPFLLLTFLLVSLVTVSLVTAQTDQENGNQVSDSVRVPILGWYLVPILGVMRRRRHELNHRNYDLITNLDY